MEFRFRFLTAALWLSAAAAQPPSQPPQPPDLNGLWSEGNSKDYIWIDQKGASLTLTYKSGIKCSGSFTGGNIDVNCPLTMATVNKKFPPEIQKMMVDGWTDIATGQPRKAIDKITGTLNDAGDGIDGIFEEDKIDANLTHGTYRILSSTRVQHKLWLGRLDVIARWQRPTDTPDRSYTADGKSVVPVKYIESRTASLSIVAKTGRTDEGSERIDLKGAVTEIRIQQSFGDKAESRPYHEGDYTASAWDGGGAMQADFDVDELLRGVNAKLNRNLLQASVKLKLLGHSISADTKTPLMILRQKLVVFIPGVMGSRIEIGGSDAYPKLSLEVIPDWAPVLGGQPFKALALGSSGEPDASQQATCLELFDEYKPVDLPIVRELKKVVYTPQDWRKILTDLEGLPPHPKLQIDGKDAAYYLYRPWSYDWRLKIEAAVDLLLSGAGAKCNPAVDAAGKDRGYATPPSIQKMVADEKDAHPFLDDKVVLVGHSTGGLIARGLLTRSGDAGQNLVDRAFFVDVPFWGAPKSYYVFLSGDMLPIISSRLMRAMAPNIPIVYYLAPSEAYSGFVASTDISNWNPGGARNNLSPTKIKRFPGQVVGGPDGPAEKAEYFGFMTTLSGQARAKVESDAKAAQVKELAAAVADVDALKAAADADPSKLAAALAHWNLVKAAVGLLTPADSGLQWNDGLEAAARSFHQSLESEPAIGFDHCVAFWSSGRDTPGPVYVDNGTPKWMKTDGDGTVPLLSQQADFPGASLLQIPANPEHDAAANDAFVWKNILEKLSNVPNDDSRRFTGVKPSGTYRVPVPVAPGEKSPQEKCAEAQKREQNASQQLAAAQQELDGAQSAEGTRIAQAKVDQLTQALADARSDYKSVVEGLGESAMDGIAIDRYNYTPLLTPKDASYIAQGFDAVYQDTDHDQAIVIAEAKGGYNGQGLDGILGEGYGYRQGTLGWVKGAARKIVQRQIPADATAEQKAAMQKEKEVAQVILDALNRGKPPVRVEVYHTPHQACVPGTTSVYQTDQTAKSQ